MSRLLLRILLSAGLVLNGTGWAAPMGDMQAPTASVAADGAAEPAPSEPPCHPAGPGASAAPEASAGAPLPHEPPHADCCDKPCGCGCAQPPPASVAARDLGTGTATAAPAAVAPPVQRAAPPPPPLIRPPIA